MTSDEDYMREAIGLAKKSLGKTSPNPAVGCILVKDSQIIGRGYHKKAGEAHAEVEALNEAGENVDGSTMYVTLEPCCHQGKTPPCTDAIIKAGVKKVVAATQDPNSQVAGKGLAELQRAGIQVQSGVLEKEAKNMNEMYEKFITTKEPFVLVKAALSADGKMAAKDGSSQWITGTESRDIVHELRGNFDAVMVGIDTVIKDDPQLTCRIEEGKNPKRIVVDSKLRIPLSAKVLNKDAETIIATTSKAPMDRIAKLESRGIKVLVVEGEGKVNLRNLIRELGSEEITSVMIEGGGKLIGSAFDEKIVDKIMFFIAPKIIGGDSPCILGDGIADVGDAISLEKVEMRKAGEDFLLVGYPK